MQIHVLHIIATIALTLPAAARDGDWIIEPLNGAVRADSDLVIVAHPLDGGAPVMVNAVVRGHGTNNWIIARWPAAFAGEHDIVIQPAEAAQPARKLRSRRLNENVTFDVVLAIDTSSSMRRHDPKNLRSQAVEQFFALARNSGRFNTVSLIAFSGKVRVLLPPTPPGAVTNLPALLKKLRPFGSTNFDKPLQQAADALAPLTGRKAVLFLSDGKTDRDYAGSHRRLAEIGATIYSVGLSKEADAGRLFRMAAETGGTYFRASDSGQLTDIFGRVFELIDRPVTLIKGSRNVAPEAVIPLFIDPTMRNPRVKLLAARGAAQARLADEGYALTTTGGIVAVSLGALGTGRHDIELRGAAQVAYEITATTSLDLQALQPEPLAAAGTPIHWHAILTQPERCTDLELAMRVTLPSGTTIEGSVHADELTGLFYGQTAADEPGEYVVALEASGQVQGVPFRRGVNLRYLRRGTRAVARTLAPRIARVAGPADPDMRRVAVGTLHARGESPASLPSFWPDPATITLSDIYPGGVTTAAATIVVNSIADDSPTWTLAHATSDRSYTIHAYGELIANRASVVTLVVTAGVDAAGQAIHSVVRVSAEDRQWELPVTGTIARPVITARLGELTTHHADGRLRIRGELTVSLTPTGQVPVQIETDFKLLQLTPDHLLAGSAPQSVDLLLNISTHADPRRWLGEIRVSGPGLADARLPFRVDTPGFVAATPCPWLMQPWLRMLLLVLMLVLVVLLSYVRADRRLAFVCASLLLHVIVLFFALPRRELEDSPQPVTTIRLISGVDVIEEQIASEQPALHPDEAAAVPTESEPMPDDSVEPDEESTRDLETERLAEISETPPEVTPDLPLERDQEDPAEIATDAVLAERKRTAIERLLREREADVEKLDAPMTPDTARAVPELATPTIAAVDEDPDEQRPDMTVERTQHDTAEIETDADAAERKHAEIERSIREREADVERLEIPLRAETLKPREELATPAMVAATEDPAELQPEMAVARTRRDAADVPTRAAGAERRKMIVDRRSRVLQVHVAKATADIKREHARMIKADALARVDEQPQAARPDLHVERTQADTAELRTRLASQQRKTEKRTRQSTAPREAPGRVIVETRADDDAQHLVAATPVSLEPTASPVLQSTHQDVRRRVRSTSNLRAAPAPVTRKQSLVDVVATPAMPAMRPAEIQHDPTAASRTIELAMVQSPRRLAESSLIAPDVPRRPVAAPPVTIDATEPIQLARRSVTPSPTAATLSDAVTGVRQPIVTLRPHSADTTAAKPVSVKRRRRTVNMSPALEEFSRTYPRSAAALAILPPGTSTDVALVAPATSPSGIRLPPGVTPVRPTAGVPLRSAAEPKRPTARDLDPSSRRLAHVRPAPTITAPQGAVPMPAQIAMGTRSIGPPRMGSSVLPTVQYDGDWDCDKTAMLNLAYQLEQRTGSIMPVGTRTVKIKDPAIDKLPFLFMTGHTDFKLTQPEVDRLRLYLFKGGYLWVNDSTDLGDDTFDAAVRRELARVLPELDWGRLPKDSNVFKGPYDLTRGYKGYAIPPGDKYRSDHIEALHIAGRPAILYTRNDYGDGLEIDPNTHPLMPSLSDLSPADMQEGSIRMGINLVMHFLNRGKAPDVEISEKIEEHDSPDKTRAKLAARPPLDFRLFEIADKWTVPEGWADALPAKITPGPNQSLTIAFGGAGTTVATRRSKVVAGAAINLSLARNRALIADVDSRSKGGCLLAVAFGSDQTFIESAPVYLRPGKNRDVVIDLRLTTFKSAESDWVYSTSLRESTPVREWYFVLYPQSGRGAITIRNVRLVRP